MADKKKKRAGIATLSDLNSAHDSDTDSDGPQEYYTGGEKSGMMVQDPSKHRQEVDSLLDRVRQFGAREGNGQVRQGSSSAPAPAPFAGAGRTLSGSSAPAAAAAPPPPLQPISHVITFWRNGFTLNDGPLRRIEDPANAPFLESIRRGEVPREMDSADPTVPIDVNFIKRDEDWKPPAKEARSAAFAGTGRTLGATAAPEVAAAAAAAVQAAGGGGVGGVVVDERKPFTSLQLRLADGTRLVARFNYEHTVGDIRGFIDAARAGAPKTYALQVMGFPPALLTDPSATIHQAGLINAVIIQKLVSLP